MPSRARASRATSPARRTRTRRLLPTSFFQYLNLHKVLKCSITNGHPPDCNPSSEIDTVVVCCAAFRRSLPARWIRVTHIYIYIYIYIYTYTYIYIYIYMYIHIRSGVSRSSQIQATRLDRVRPGALPSQVQHQIALSLYIYI